MDNHLADYLSCNRPDPLEWSLAGSLCLKLWDRWGLPQIDLFASESIHKLPVWFSRSLCQSAAGADALRQNWEGLRVYAFPPFNLILCTLQKLRADGVEWAIVVTHWPKRTWVSNGDVHGVRTSLDVTGGSQSAVTVPSSLGNSLSPGPLALKLVALKLNATLGC